jgi:hypothetical protein
MIPVRLDENRSSSEIPRPINRLGLAALLCGSMALLAASIPYLQVLSLALSVAGLVLGSLGIARPRGIVFPVAGLAVSLPAFCLAVLGTFWDGGEEASENRQKLIPLRNQLGAGGGPSQAELGQETMWVDASKDAVQQGDVRVRLVSAGVEPVELKESSGKKRFGEKCLVIKLRISNAGAGQLIPYSSWDQSRSADPALVPVLHDAGGKNYPLRVFEPGQEAVGHVSTWSIAPGKFVDDILVFEAVARVEFLRLELPCQAFQEDDTIRLQIPGRMITSKAGR